MPLYLIKFKDPIDGDSLIEQFFRSEQDILYKLSEDIFFLYSHNDQIKMTTLFKTFEEKIGKEIFMFPLSPYEGHPKSPYYIGTPTPDVTKLESLLSRHYQDWLDSRKEGV